ALMFQYQSNRSLADFRGVLRRRLHGSILSRVGASGKAGAVQTDPAQQFAQRLAHTSHPTLPKAGSSAKARAIHAMTLPSPCSSSPGSSTTAAERMALKIPLFFTQRQTPDLLTRIGGLV